MEIRKKKIFNEIVTNIRFTKLWKNICVYFFLFTGNGNPLYDILTFLLWFIWAWDVFLSNVEYKFEEFYFLSNVERFHPKKHLGRRGEMNVPNMRFLSEIFIFIHLFIAELKFCVVE